MSTNQVRRRTGWYVGVIVGCVTGVIALIGVVTGNGAAFAFWGVVTVVIFLAIFLPRKQRS